MPQWQWRDEARRRYACCSWAPRCAPARALSTSLGRCSCPSRLQSQQTRFPGAATTPRIPAPFKGYPQPNAAATAANMTSTTVGPLCNSTSAAGMGARPQHVLGGGHGVEGHQPGAPQVHAAPRPLQKCLQWEPSSNAAQRDRSPTGLLDATTATRAASRSSTSGATCSWGSPHSTVEAAEPGCLAVLGYVLTQCTTGSHPRHPAPPRHGD